MITFVCWKWASANGSRHYTAAHVNVLAAMVDRYAPFPHRFVCITEAPDGLAPRIEVFPMPQTGLEAVKPPSRYAHRTDWDGGYRRLWLFSAEAAVLGDRLVCFDIDCIITGDLAPLIATPGNFVGWADPKRFQPGKIAGAVFMLTPGTHTEVWDDFDPDTSPQLACDAGCQGGEQAWMSYKLFPPEGRWTEGDGVVKIGWCPTDGQSPGLNTRIVLTTGTAAPWHAHVQARYPWVREYWRG